MKKSVLYFLVVIAGASLLFGFQQYAHKNQIELQLIEMKVKEDLLRKEFMEMQKLYDHCQAEMTVQRTIFEEQLKTK